LANPVAQQIDALVVRGMAPAALALGTDMLGRLGVEVPAVPDRGARIGNGLKAFHEWLNTCGDAADHTEVTDPRLLAVARVSNRLVLAAFYTDPSMLAWLVMCAAEMWIDHGSCESLAGTLAYLGLATIGSGGDYRDAYHAVCHVLQVCEAHDYEPGTSHVKFMHAVVTAAWFEPLEHTAELLRSARGGLLRGGDLHNALRTWYASLIQTLFGGDLDSLRQEVGGAFAFADRLGTAREQAVFAAVERMVEAMRAGVDEPPAGFDEDAYLASLEKQDLLAAYYLAVRTLSAAVLGDDAALIRYSRKAAPLLTGTRPAYVSALLHVTAVLSAQARARTSSGQEREEALADLDRSREFLAARGADHPRSFRHLARLAEATAAAAHGDFADAAAAYDAAMSDAMTTGAAWHRPMIYERAAMFYLDHGLPQVGTQLLAEAVHGYADWGATGKVRSLRTIYPTLSATAASRGTASVSNSQSMELSTGGIDLLAVLEAARALSSETDMDRLRIRVQHVLGQLTGATAVHVVLWDDRANGWTLPADGARPELPVAEAARRGLLPLTAIRYAERTQANLLVDDASLDERVRRDPYFAGQDTCSLLVVPVLGHGKPRAVLVLENRLNRHAFSTGRLDAVMLVAGQLTVSLENARLYASLERKVTERTEELAEANHRLEQLTVTDPLTGLPNRRKLMTFLTDEWQRARATGAPVSIMMIDIDQFKQFNDHYGHQRGDACLCLVAEALRTNLRDNDLVARYGGEEFCVVVPGAGKDQARIAAERLRAAVAGLSEPHAFGTSGVVTVSVGVAAGSPAPVADPAELTKLADEALYEAKRAGRNRVAVG
jgi:diguanylate cyclase (GGDEF)-like protein